MKIYIGSDHAGYELKEKLKIFLKDLGHEVIDKGAFKLDNDDDYPDYIIPVAKAVAEVTEPAEHITGTQLEERRGIILGGSGQGEAMSANRIEGVRATEYYGGDPEIIKVSREHNDANILSLGARFMDEEVAEEAVRLFLETPFSGDKRHIRRLNKLEPNS